MNHPSRRSLRHKVDEGIKRLDLPPQTRLQTGAMPPSTHSKRRKNK